MVSYSRILNDVSMIVSATPTNLSLNELLDLFRKEFPSYSCDVFGLGSQKNIIVKKSNWVAAQVTVRDGSIFIDGSFSNLLLSGLMSLLSLGHLTSFKGWFELEKQLAKCLKSVYH